jgi:hypothetical protein
MKKTAEGSQHAKEEDTKGRGEEVQVDGAREDIVSQGRERPSFNGKIQEAEAEA